MAALPSSRRNFFLALDCSGMAIRGTQARTINGVLCSDARPATRPEMASYAMYAAEARKQSLDKPEADTFRSLSGMLTAMGGHSP